MATDGNPGHVGVAKVDAAGRRWYTSQFKGEIVARCLQTGASVTGIAVDHGLNPNMVRKWMCIEIHIGDTVIVIGAKATNPNE